MAEENQTNPYADRKALTFEQAEGAEPLPSQLKPKELSKRLRAVLWAGIYHNLQASFYRTVDGDAEFLDQWENIFRWIHVDREHRMIDEFQNDFHALVKKTKATIETGDYLAVFGWIQYVLRHGPPGAFADIIQAALKQGHAAYCVVDGDTIVPIASETDRETLQNAIADVAATEFHGARKHLREAAQNLTAGRYADSVRESIHAVESVISVLEPKGDFAKALSKLEAKTGIHGALKSGFNSIYGFTSDEKGIRHPLLEKGDPNVDEADALFMLGACAAFVSYLINKARAAKLL